MLKLRQIKKRSIVVDDVQYIYSVTEHTADVQIRVYIDKSPLLLIHFSYPESWGIDVFRPKTIELLIRYFHERHTENSQMTELWLYQETALFEIYLAYFFSAEEQDAKEHYLKHIAEHKHPKQNL